MSSGVPSRAILPFSIKMARSQNSRTAAMLWVTRMTV